MSEALRDIIMRPIGVVRSPHRTSSDAPPQPIYGEQVDGEVILDDDFASALDDIEGFERIWLIFCLDRARPWKPKVVPYRETRLRGLFSTRAPSRPNPIGLSVVRLLGREGNVLRVRGVDMLDGTPLLDIKPYVPRIDAFCDSKAGWVDEREPTDLG